MREILSFTIILILSLVVITSCNSVGPSSAVTPVILPSPTATSIPSSGAPSSLLPSMQVKQFKEAPITITRQSDGQVLHVNLVKFVGSCSPDTSILINNVPAIVDQDGNYFLFLDLAKGRNVIQIKATQGTNISTDSLAITFEPPVAVVFTSGYDNNTNYRKAPFPVTGLVNNPAAEVSIYQALNNMTRATVTPDGTFSAQMYLKDIPPEGSGFILTAIAKLGDEMDNYWWAIGFNKDGKFVPGGGPYRGSTADILPKDTLKIVAGNSGVFDYVMNVQVMNAQYDNFPSGNCKLIMVRLADTNATRSGDNGNINTSGQPARPGLTGEIMPSEFTIYPNIHYHINIQVTTSPTLTPGTYYFGVQGFPHSMGKFIITVIVEPR